LNLGRTNLWGSGKKKKMFGRFVLPECSARLDEVGKIRKEKCRTRILYRDHNKVKEREINEVTKRSTGK